MLTSGWLLVQKFIKSPLPLLCFSFVCFFVLPETCLWIRQIRGNSHGWATSTQVCIPARGAVLLEGAGRETPTKVKHVHPQAKRGWITAHWRAASFFSWIKSRVSSAGRTSLRLSCRSSSRWVETTRPSWKRSWSNARAETRSCIWTTTGCTWSWRTSR